MAGPGQEGRGEEAGRWAESCRVPEHVEEQSLWSFWEGFSWRITALHQAGGSGDQHPSGPGEKMRVDRWRVGVRENCTGILGLGSLLFLFGVLCVIFNDFLLDCQLKSSISLSLHNSNGNFKIIHCSP